VAVLKAELRRLGMSFSAPVLDTLTFSRKLYPEMKSHKLGSVCKQLGVSLKNAHRAVHDARATGEVLIKTLESFFIATDTERSPSDSEESLFLCALALSPVITDISGPHVFPSSFKICDGISLYLMIGITTATVNISSGKRSPKAYAPPLYIPKARASIVPTKVARTGERPIRTPDPMAAAAYMNEYSGTAASPAATPSIKPLFIPYEYVQRSTPSIDITAATVSPVGDSTLKKYIMEKNSVHIPDSTDGTAPLAAENIPCRDTVIMGHTAADRTIIQRS